MIVNSRAGRIRAKPRLVMKQRMRMRTKSTTRMIEFSSILVTLTLALMAFINISDERRTYAATSGDYRSAASGNWNSTSTWEKFNGSSWVAASATPTSADSVITIQSGHIVTITASVTVDQVVINSGGEVDLNSGKTLTIANGAGTDFDVSGTFYRAGTVTINASATMAYENGGKYQHGRNGSSIPTSTWNTGSTCEIKGITNTAPSNLGQSFYNFTWNCTSQSGSINLGGGLTIVNGDLTVTSTGSSASLQLSTTSFTFNISGNYNQTAGTVSVLTSNNATGTLNVSGNWSHSGGTLTVGGNSSTNAQIVFNKSGTQTFTASGNTVSGNVDFTVNSSSILDLGSSTMVCRNFTAAAASTLDISSPNGITASNINASGTSTFNSSSNFIFNGNSAQVTGSGFPAAVNNLTINNSSGITLSANVTVAGTLTLTSGKVTTGSYELKATNTSTTSIAGYSSSGYVIGNLRRSVSATGSYDFPLGTTANYELVNVNLSSMTGFTDVLGTFTNANPVDVNYPLTGISINGTSITDMLDYGYWTLTPNNPMTGGTYSVTLNEKGHSNAAADPMAYCVLKRANATSSWQSLGTHSNSTQSETGGVAVASRSALSSFSHFAIAKGAGALPIELVFFDAKPSGNAVKCSWQTASEINNDYFTIERSNNGRDFTPIATVRGAGNSNALLNYSATDDKPLKGMSYYRLKQTDFDGHFTYSKIKSVIQGKENADEMISISSVSPNPFKENFSVTYSIQQSADVDITVMSATGQQVYHEKQNAEKGINRFDYNEGNNLPVGIYFVRISFEDKVQIKKIIKN